MFGTRTVVLETRFAVYHTRNAMLNIRFVVLETEFAVLDNQGRGALPEAAVHGLESSFN